MTGLAALPPLGRQAARLVELGLHTAAGLDPDRLVARAEAAQQSGHGLLALHPDVVAASALVPLVRRPAGQNGFLVMDMQDVDAFRPIDGLGVPGATAYVVDGVDRGDDLRSWSPDEALPELRARGRSPLLLTEGLHWLLQVPDVLERNHCFMTIGSRLRKGDRLDARTPALWISGGTGRDGPARRDAPKAGWCWAGNRHSWLGFASAQSRRAA